MSAVPSVGSPARGDDHTWPDVLSILLTGEDLSAGATQWAMNRIMRGEASNAQLAGFAVALRA